MGAAIVFSTVKVLRALRFGGAAATGAAAGAPAGAVGAARGASLLERTRLIGVRLAPRGAVGRTIVKSGAVASIALVVVRHPSVLNDLLDHAAAALGWNPFLLRAVGWALPIGVALAIVAGLVRPLMVVAAFALSMLLRASRRMELRARR